MGLFDRVKDKLRRHHASTPHVVLIGARALKDTTQGWATPFATVQALESRLGKNFALLNDSTGSSLGVSGDGTFTSTGGVVTTSQWPTVDGQAAIQSGHAIYQQIHANQSSSSGKPSDFKWLDIIQNNSPYRDANNNAVLAKQAIQAIAAAYTAYNVSNPFRLYFSFHHEPEDDAKVNGFGQGNPIIDANGNYTGATGVTFAVSGNFIGPANITTSDITGKGIPGTGWVNNGSALGSAQYDSWSGTTLHISSGQTLVANSGQPIYQAWTQDLTATLGDSGQAAAAGGMWANAANQWHQWWHDVGFYPGATGCPLLGRTGNLQTNNYNGSFGGSDVWLSGLNSSLYDIVSQDNYLKPGSSTATVNGTQTSPTSGTFSLATHGTFSGYPSAGVTSSPTSANVTYTSWDGTTLVSPQGSYPTNVVFTDGKALTKNYIGTNQDMTNLNLGLAAAQKYGKAFGVGEHGYAPNATHSGTADTLSKAYYFQSVLGPWIQANAAQLAFFCFQANTPPQHPYADFDSGNQAQTTAAFLTLFPAGSLSYGLRQNATTGAVTVVQP